MEIQIRDFLSPPHYLIPIVTVAANCNRKF